MDARIDPTLRKPRRTGPNDPIKVSGVIAVVFVSLQIFFKLQKTRKAYSLMTFLQRTMADTARTDDAVAVRRSIQCDHQRLFIRQNDLKQ